MGTTKTTFEPYSNKSPTSGFSSSPFSKCFIILFLSSSIPSLSLADTRTCDLKFLTKTSISSLFTVSILFITTTWSKLYLAASLFQTL